MPIDFQRPHRRYNPLLDEWVLVSPQRTQRPWQGKVEPPPPRQPDPNCYLCPGNRRAGGAVNPNFDGTYWFENDFAALSPQDGDGQEDDGLYHAQQERGLCRVLIYSPDHFAHFSELGPERVFAIVLMWQQQYRDLAAVPWVGWVQIFENRGEMMGASNPHPHGQVWASRSLPDLPSRLDTNLRRYWERTGKNLLQVLGQTETGSEREVLSNSHWLAFVPFWAVWPFEVYLLPRTRVRDLTELAKPQARALAEILCDLVRTYDAVFEVPFPYSMGIYQAPPRSSAEHWGLWFVFAPPLLRSASVRKFMVGYEMFAGPQRDLTPEQAAQRLREARDRAGVPALRP